ncbi:acyl-CoA dehydrogenase family protein [Lyngbya aestuarii]|uniref:acyl-CoA dehydrogenase family protein n=1 Tax=Lyngbya aestuarii TaxID=118322 RepID=UPI00403DCA88
MSPSAKNQGIAHEIKKDDQQELLDVAESYLKESVAPLASEIDSTVEVLQDALEGMGKHSLLALKVPQSWGGAQVSQEIYHRFLQLVVRYSGALGFLQIQHQSAAGLLSQSENESLKQQYLPLMGKGQVLVGIGFSQLRRRGNPLVRAIPLAGGYQIKGQVPWITGFGFFKDFIVGAMLPDGQELYGMVPLRDTFSNAGGAITFSEPMQLAVMESTNTVSANFTDWFLSSEQVVLLKPQGAIHEKDKKNVIQPGFLSLGCAQAGLDIMEATARNKKLNFLNQAFDSLQEEFNRCEDAMIQALPPEALSFEERLQLRAWAINLAGRCSQAAVIVSSGTANYKYHAAQRVYREALVFSVSGQTTLAMEASLNRLLHS